jgi:hypothetical protein
MENGKHRCEAEVHDPRCNGWADSVDHFTAKAIARILGWTHEEIVSPDNKQHLNSHCHRLKDKSTQARVELATALVKGDQPVTLKKYERSIKRADGFIEIPTPTSED